MHFALNCQSAGCPVLPNRAFPVDGLQDFLDEATRAFVNDPKNVRVEGNELHLSQIFEWYAEDFRPGGAAAFVRTWLDGVPADPTIVTIPYDWALIAQPGRGP